MKNALAAVVAASICTFGILSDAKAADVVQVTGPSAFVSLHSNASECTDADGRFVFDSASFFSTFTLPAGRWQPFLSNSTKWKVAGNGGVFLAGFVEVDVIELGSDPFPTQTLATFIRGFDSTGLFDDTIPFDQDLGMFNVESLGDGEHRFELRVTAFALCGGENAALATQARIENVGVNFLAL